MRLSYILPIYNVEQYLAQCLDSIFSQDLPEDDYEVICVNDCSTDGSVEVMEHYKFLHSNMHILSFAKNRGLSAARNEGVKIAKGKYIWFVDSDDFIGDNTAKPLLYIAEEKALDVLLFNYCDYTDEIGIVNEPHTFAEHSTQSGIDFVNEGFGDAFVYHLGYGGATFRYVDIDIADFDLTGFSHSNNTKIHQQFKEEEMRMREELLLGRLNAYCKDSEKKVQLYDELHAHKWIWKIVVVVGVRQIKRMIYN